MEPVETTFDFSLMTRFDPSVEPMQITVQAGGIRFVDCEDSFSYTDRYVIYIGKNGKTLVIKAEPSGFAVERAGRSDSQKMIKCKAAIAALKRRGIAVPQTCDLEYSEDAGVWYAYLKGSM